MSSNFQTPHLSLPLMLASQSDKHVTFNEALSKLDRQVQVWVNTKTLGAPPVTPIVGDGYIISDNATGAWIGHNAQIAFWDLEQWQFITPQPGMQAWVIDEQKHYFWDAITWAKLGEQQSKLGINATADAANRFVVASTGTLFNHDGQGHQLKVNKATSGDTASLLFQDAYSGRAEVGIAGGDDFSIKVSPNGSVWKTALAVDRTTGIVSMPQNQRVETFQLLTTSSAVPFTTSSNTPIATGITLTITPTRPNSRFKISGHATLGADFWYTVPQLSLYRNGMKVWPSGAGFLEHQLLANSSSNSGYVSFTTPFTFFEVVTGLDPLAYEIRLSSRLSGLNVYLNRRHLDTLPRGDTLLIVEEITV
jgi:Protein of unknown function (DUF2793)